MSTVRVLMIVDHIGTNGTITHILSIVRSLRTKGVSAVIAGKIGSMHDRIHEERIPYYEIDFPDLFTNEIQKFPGIMESLERIIQKEKITLIHGHQAYSSYLVSKFAQSNNIPYIYTVHGLYNTNDELMKMISQSDEVIAVSPYVYSHLNELSSKKPIFIPNGIDLNEFKLVSSKELREQLKIPMEAITIFYASRLEWKKAKICMMLLKSVMRLKRNVNMNIHIIIAGEGKREKQIKDMAVIINKKQPENIIHFVGQQTYLNEYFSLADCIIGTGRTALEGLACDKQVIAVGNKGYLGLVTEDNWEQARYSHFGDHTAPNPLTEPILMEDIKSQAEYHDSNKKTKSLRSLVLKDFNLEQTVNSLIKLYKKY
ncbi:glycosyltransferase involved in cell wall biosynthesis [Cytobacillus horneckiae]|uniref:glycosyltransferase n=1 Tax=Cytobacillus horneckiae TaxID=549687 RepID=UPI0019CFE5F2|nr:glycosyltransferase [Cytobacillus horneckiae]MBN6886595.1 glycosyltransferase [Cytobacillus horneckiae]MCM3177936.1 glycosyltransferase [Cytobacillus horneckiae]